MKRKSGFTLIELLIVVSILALLLIAVFFSVSKQRSKAEDARAKGELDRLKIAFEDYYNDHNCYPPAAWFDGPEDCNSQNLRPYMTNLQCDRKTGLPYKYETDPTGCKSFMLYGIPDSTNGTYCDSDGNLYTYETTSSNIAASTGCPTPTPAPSVAPSIAPSPSPSPSPLPSPSASPNIQYYCQQVGSCQPFNTAVWDCIPSYADSACAASNNCSNTGSCFHK